jgi:hypothetical protein
MRAGRIAVEVALVRYNPSMASWTTGPLSSELGQLLSTSLRTGVQRKDFFGVFLPPLIFPS